MNIGVNNYSDILAFTFYIDYVSLDTFHVLEHNDFCLRCRPFNYGELFLFIKCSIDQSYHIIYLFTANAYSYKIAKNN